VITDKQRFQIDFPNATTSSYQVVQPLKAMLGQDAIQLVG
jgi:hypothetical protein